MRDLHNEPEPERERKPLPHGSALVYIPLGYVLGALSIIVAMMLGWQP